MDERSSSPSLIFPFITVVVWLPCWSIFLSFRLFLSVLFLGDVGKDDISVERDVILIIYDATIDFVMGRFPCVNRRKSSFWVNVAVNL